MEARALHPSIFSSVPLKNKSPDLSARSGEGRLGGFSATGLPEEFQSEVASLISELKLVESSAPAQPAAGPRKIAVLVPGSYEQALPEFRQRVKQAAGEAEVIFCEETPEDETLKSVDGYMGYFSPELVKKAGEKLCWLHNYPVGINQVKELSDAEKNRVLFTNTKRLSGYDIASHAMVMLLELTRNMPQVHHAQQKKEWGPPALSHEGVGSLNKKTMLITGGNGGIGSQLTKMAKGFCMKVIITCHSSDKKYDMVDEVGAPDQLKNLAARADVVVNTLPSTDETTHLFNKAFFQSCKKGPCFINVGRGDAVNTPDLVDALKTRQVSAAGLDVFESEPLSGEHPFWGMNNVIVSPHQGHRGDDSKRNGALIAVENLRRYVSNQPLLNPVDANKGY